MSRGLHYVVVLLLLFLCVSFSYVLAEEEVEEASLLEDQMNEFNNQVDVSEEAQDDTNQALLDESLLEVESEDSPSYTLNYPALQNYYTNFLHSGPLHPHVLAGGYAGLRGFHGFGGYTPYAPASFPYAYNPHLLPSLGVNPALFPAMWHVSETDMKGGYNVHGLNSGGAFPYFHPGLAKDLGSLSGKHGDDEEGGESLIEHSAEIEQEEEREVMQAENAIEEDIQEISALETESEGEDGGEDDHPDHPTYVLPFPPVLPGHYSPLFHPYSNVNPLSSLAANIAAQPAVHPGVAAAAAGHAGRLAAISAQIPGAAGGYSYYPFAARHPLIAAQLAGNPVPLHGYAGWIHPQNLNSAAVGDNEPEDFPQFVEVSTSEGVDVEDLSCNGCEYN